MTAQWAGEVPGVDGMSLRTSVSGAQLDLALADIGKNHETAAVAMLADPMRERVNGAAIRTLFAAYQRSHSHPGAFDCCSAHAVADTVPDLLAERANLLAEVGRLTAENDALTADLAVPGEGNQC